MIAARRRAGAAAVAGALLCAGFAGLGDWQLQRLAWKRELIAAVDARVSAPPQAPPGPAAWPSVTAGADAYRHVRVGGVFANDQETLVQAVTEAGPGFWVLTPLRADAGWTVLVNRGFVPAASASPTTRRTGQVAGHATVTGLLRLSEPGGGFLRANRPEAGRWYSRDVAAIADARGLTRTAPYFIDADATPNPGWPKGGETIIDIPNNHFDYALTWFGLAGVLFGVYLAWHISRGRLGFGRSNHP